MPEKRCRCKPKPVVVCEEKTVDECCNLLLTSYGESLQEASALVTARLSDAVALDIVNPNVYNGSLLNRILAIRVFYVTTKQLVESYITQANKCNSDCCVGLANGAKGLVIGIADIAVANALNPLFAPPPDAGPLGVLFGLTTAFNELFSGLNVLLDNAGCIELCPTEIEFPPFPSLPSP